MPNAPLPDVLHHLASRYDDHVRDLHTFVGIPTVSTVPEHAGDVRRGAEWVAGRLRSAGPIDVRLVETPRHPAVIGRWDGAAGAPTVLVYGHLDVQPPDPLDAWHTPPFVLTERDGRWYGRGVSDDKASMLIPILVAEAFFAHGTPPVNLRFLFEAEEEIASPHLPQMVRDHAEELACDVVLSADGGMWRPDVPTLTLSARGIAALEVRVRTSAKDLHSGRHGGGVANPIHALAEIVAGLHQGGRVAVAGFYDGVIAPSAEELSALERLPFDESSYLAQIGASAAVGEAGYGTLARQWLRPTLEANGIGGGYQGVGKKTVIPSEAFVKITCRLVHDQDPDAVIDAVRAHLESHRPAGVTLDIQAEEGASHAYRMPDDHFVLAPAEEVLEEVFGTRVARVGMGGTVPICTTFRAVLGADTLFFSFSVADEDIHAPNEFYRAERFRLGLEAWAKLWDRLGSV